jgi:hypothetical protein
VARVAGVIDADAPLRRLKILEWHQNDDTYLVLQDPRRAASV